MSLEDEIARIKRSMVRHEACIGIPHQYQVVAAVNNPVIRCERCYREWLSIPMLDANPVIEKLAPMVKDAFLENKDVEAAKILQIVVHDAVVAAMPELLRIRDEAITVMIRDPHNSALAMLEKALLPTLTPEEKEKLEPEEEWQQKIKPGWTNPTDCE